MCQYRVYVLDGGRHVRRAADVEADDDEAALLEAARLGPVQSVEVWKLDRFLCRFDPLDRPAA